MSRKFFLVDLEYSRPLDEVDTLRDAHIQFLEKQYAEANFIFSGPKVPRSGGVILAMTKSREKLDSILKNDPFMAAGIARYTVTEFVPAMCAEDFQGIIDRP